jgi:hypothetical protein
MRKGIAPLILMIAVFAVIMLLPLLLAEVFEEFKWLLIAYFCIIIYMFVKRILGSGLVTYVVSGILIYIFVFQLFHLFTSLYMLYLIVGVFGLSGIIIFGLQKH